jgi:hypothetical protein
MIRDILGLVDCHLSFFPSSSNHLPSTVHHPKQLFFSNILASTMTYYKGFPPVCAGPATKAKEKTDPTLESSNPWKIPVPYPPQLFNVDHLANAASQMHISAPEQARVQDQEPDRASKEEPETTNEICDKDRCVLPGEGAGCSVENVFLDHGDPKPAEWRNRVMNEWYTSNARKSRPKQCRYADMLHRYDMPPCPQGWGKILYERLRSHGRDLMENDDPKVILAEYRQRHLQEERHKGPKLRMVPQVNPESHMWEIDPAEGPSQPPPCGYRRYPEYSGLPETLEMARKGKQKVMVHGGEQNEMVSNGKQKMIVRDGEQNETVCDGKQKKPVKFSKCGFCGDCNDCRWR